MNEFLAELYGTSENIGATPGNDTEKLAQAEYLGQLFEADGIDINQVDPATIEKVASAVFGTDNQIKLAEDEKKKHEKDESEEEEEKEEEKKEGSAEEKLAEADFLGRVMAHSFVDEQAAIQKEAASFGGAVKAVKETAGKGHELVKRLGKKIIGEERLGRVGLHGAGKETSEQASRMLEGGMKPRRVQATLRKRPELGEAAIEHARRSMSRAAAGAGYGALGLGAAGAAGLVGGGAAAVHAMKKKESALDVLAEQRAMEILEQSGVQDESQKLASAVEERAWEMLSEAGYVVEDAE